MSQPVSFREIAEASPDEAYARVLPEAMALPEAQIRALNVDVQKIVLIAMSALKRLPAVEAELRALSWFPTEQLDRVADYTLALYSAHIRYCFTSRPAEKVPELNEAAVMWREILLTEARSLVARKHLQGEQLKKLVSNHGYRRVARDLAGLAQIFKDNWERIKNDTGLKDTHVAEADKLAFKLTYAISKRVFSPEQISAARDIRARIFTLLYRAYEQLRRGVQYLRWQGDIAEKMIPSLYSGRRRAKATTENAEAPAEPSAASFDDASANAVVPTEDSTHVALPAPQWGPRVPPMLANASPFSDEWEPPHRTSLAVAPVANEAAQGSSAQEFWRRLESKPRSPPASFHRRAKKGRLRSFPWR
jgi:hypothetical protein